MANDKDTKDTSAARRSLYDEHLASVEKSVATLAKYEFVRPKRVNWGHVADIAHIDNMLENAVIFLEDEKRNMEMVL